MGKLRTLTLVALLSSGLFTATGTAQVQKSTERKVLHSVVSVYPPIAKKNRIGAAAPVLLLPIEPKNPL
jgi:hypothetical protein